MVTLLCPGEAEACVDLVEGDSTEGASRLQIDVYGRDWRTVLTLVREQGGVPRLQ
jgi:hypothetical protein